MEIALLAQFLKSVPLFSHLSETELQKIAERSKIYTFEKDTYIFKKNSFPTCFFIIKSGSIEEIVTDSNDFTTIVKLRNTYDYMGELGVLLKEPYISTARTLSEVKLVGIPQEIFRHLVFNNEKTMKFILKTLSQRLQNSAETTISFLMFNSEGRVAYRLYMMLRELEGNALNIQTTQENLSQLCAVTRQTISIILNNWKKEGIIETHRGYLEIIDKDRLVDIFLENTICR